MSLKRPISFLFLFSPHFLHLQICGIGAYWFRMQLYCMFIGKERTPEAQLINTTHFCISGSLHMNLSTLGKEICEFLSSGKSLGRCGHKQGGLWKLGCFWNIRVPLADGWKNMCMLFPWPSHSYQATHSVSPDAPDSPKVICLKPHSSFSSVDQQLKQGGLSEKIQWPRNALVVVVFVLFFSKGPTQADRTIVGLSLAILMV